MKRKTSTIANTIIASAALMAGAANAGLLGTVADALSSPSIDRTISVEKCVELPSSDSYFAGVATPLTGPIGIDLPSTGTVTVCAATSCDVSGGVEIEPLAPSFSDCDIGYTVSGSGEGSCVTTVSVKTILGERTLHASRSVSEDGDPLFPLEVCLANTSD
jgi:hypothetical protein